MPTRRDFLKGLFTILPAATSYKRIWKALENSPIIQPEYVVNPDYINAEYEVVFIYGSIVNQPPPILFKRNKLTDLWNKQEESFRVSLQNGEFKLINKVKLKV